MSCNKISLRSVHFIDCKKKTLKILRELRLYDARKDFLSHHSLYAAQVCRRYEKHRKADQDKKQVSGKTGVREQLFLI